MPSSAAPAVPVEPTAASAWNDSGSQHRLVSARITVTGSKIAAAPKQQRRPLPIRVHDYSDRRGWSEVFTALKPIVEETAADFDEGASTGDIVGKLNALLAALTSEQLRPLRPPRGPKPPPGKRTVAIPGEAAILLSKARRLLRRSSALFAKGRQSAIAAGHRCKAAARAFSKEGKILCTQQRASSVTRLVDHISNNMVKAPSQFWKQLREDAVDVYTTSRLIPDGPGGKASDTFPRAARELFSAPQRRPPALAPESGDRHTRHVPRPISPLVGGALGNDFRWEEFYTVMFGPPPGRPPDICEHSSRSGRPCPMCLETRARYEAAKTSEISDGGKTLRTSVAAGPDGIPSEVFCWARHADHVPGNDAADRGETHSLRQRLSALLADVSNDMLRTGRVPKGFTMAHVKLLLKEGRGGAFVDPTLFASYRPISVISLVHKVLKLVLTRRFSHYWVSAGIIGPEQAGFSHRLSTENNIFLVFETLRRRAAMNEETWALFVDIARAYDTVNHEGLLEILRIAGVADSMVRLIQALLADASFRLEINGDLSDPIPVRVGLPQGDPLSCVLFLVFIESLARSLDAAEAEEAPAATGAATAAAPATAATVATPAVAAAAAAEAAPAPPRGVRTAGAIVRDALYADDFVGLAPSHAETVRTRRLIERWMGAWCMTTNAKRGKSEVVRFARRGEAQTPNAAHPDIPPIIYPGKPPWFPAWAYRLLGVLLTHNLDLGPHFEKMLRGTVGEFNALLFHRSMVMQLLPPSRLLQLRKTFSQFYALAVIPASKDVVRDIDEFLITSAAAIWRLSAKNTSRLLIAAISATPSAFSTVLKERLRCYLGFLRHPSRHAAPGSPRHVSIDAFDAMKAEFEGPRQPNALPNWIRDTDDLLQRFRGTPLAHTLGDFAALEWPFESGRLLRAFIAGVTYAEAHAAYRREILPQDCVIGADPPRLNGSTKAALYYCLGFSLPPSLFQIGARPLPISATGPALPSILAYATNPRSVIDVVVKALAGFSSLYHAPWTRSKGQLAPTALLPRPPPPPTAGGDGTATVAPPHFHWNEYQGCVLCGRTDSVFHVATECTHPAVAAARARLLRSAQSIFLPRLIQLLAEARLRPADRGEPIELALSEDEHLALGGIASRPIPDALPPEMQHVIYRLLTASPWPARATLPGHYVARGLGRYFDACIAEKGQLRDLATVWTAWASLSLTKLADARWAALTSEAERPSLPRPPPWQRPPPVLAAPAPGQDLAALPDWGNVSGPPPDGHVAPLEFHDVIMAVARRWYNACGRGALASILSAAIANAALAQPMATALRKSSVTPPANPDAMHKPVLIAILLRLGMFWGGSNSSPFSITRYLPASSQTAGAALGAATGTPA